MNPLSDPYRRRWIGWSLVVAAFFLVSLHRSATAVLSSELSAAFDTSAVQLGLLHSSFFVLYAVFQVPAGLLTDRYGARVIAAGGTALMSAGALAFGLASSYPVAFLGRLCVGLGASVLFVSALRFCANWFRPDEFGTMTGATFSVAVFGGLASTTPLALSIDAAGWRATVAGLGVVGLVVAVAVAVFAHDSPAAAGLPAVENVPERPAVTGSDLRRYVRDAVVQPETWLLGIMLFFVTGIGLTIFGLWAIPYLGHVYGLSTTAASVYLALGYVGGIVGPTLFGWVSDRLARRTELIVLSAVAFGATWVAFAAFERVPLVLVAGIFLFSRLLRGGISLAYTVIKERHPEGASGTVIGLINTMAWIGAAVFPVVLGAALDAYALDETINGAQVYSVTGYRVAFAIAVAAGLVAAACALALHVRTRGERPFETGSAAGGTVD